MSRRRTLLLWLLPLLLLLVAVGGFAAWRSLGFAEGPQSPAGLPRLAAEIADPVARGAYLARVGGCRSCHTERGGADYAGGRGIPTAFGTFYAPNLTPDRETGLGAWTGEDFWRALHEGRGKDGEPLYPVFPYTHYTRVARPDADALFAYLRSLPPVRQPRRPHALHAPFDQRWLLRAWRALYFTPGVYQPDADKDVAWNRGAYLVQGLSHCGACHQARNALGALRAGNSGEATGGLVLDWYAPALDSSAEAGVQHWPLAETVQLLASGQNRQASTLGPMAEVVYDSLQHLQGEDLAAMARYLQQLPDRAAAGAQQSPARGSARLREAAWADGARLYREHCAECHGDAGEGRAPAAPALAGNRAVVMAAPVNVIRVLLYGGYAPSTALNPRPFGMPPFATALNDAQAANLLSYVRGSWGNAAAPVRDFEIARARTGPLW